MLFTTRLGYLIPVLISCIGHLSATEHPLTFPAEPTIREGETHVYTLDLTAGTSVKIHFQQESVYMFVKVTDPHGFTIFNQKTLAQYRDSVMVGFVAEQNGRYHIQVTPDGFFDGQQVNAALMTPYHASQGRYRATLLYVRSVVEQMRIDCNDPD